MRIFGLILAGGGGRRMGGADKALLPLAGQPLLSHVLARFEPQVEALALSANGDPSRFARFGLPVLPDGVGEGPLAGVLAGLDWAAARGAAALVSVSVDTPFVPGDLVPRLWLAGDGGLAVAESAGRAHPTCALWPLGLRADLRDWLALGEAKVMRFADRYGAARAVFADDGAFRNLNTPDDLSAAEAILKAGA